jgi:ribosomal protein S18 acetylase RimI-like enzyme
MKGKIKKVSVGKKSEISNFISEYDEEFTPSLSNRVNIQKYTSKLLKRGKNYVYEIEGNIKGLISFYANNYDKKEAYLSIILVAKKYRKSRVADRMMQKMNEYCKKENFQSIKLEMSSEKKGLKKWYESKGYKVEKEYEREGNKCSVMYREI